MYLKYPFTSPTICLRGGIQKCIQGTPLVKARNSKKLNMLNLKFAWISDPAVNTMQTPVVYAHACIRMYTHTSSDLNTLHFSTLQLSEAQE